jgi:hypothetical protein
LTPSSDLRCPNSATIFHPEGALLDNNPPKGQAIGGTHQQKNHLTTISKHRRVRTRFIVMLGRRIIPPSHPRIIPSAAPSSMASKEPSANHLPSPKRRPLRRLKLPGGSLQVKPSAAPSSTPSSDPSSEETRPDNNSPKGQAISSTHQQKNKFPSPRRRLRRLDPSSKPSAAPSAAPSSTLPSDPSSESSAKPSSHHSAQPSVKSITDPCVHGP